MDTIQAFSWRSKTLLVARDKETNCPVDGGPSAYTAVM